MLLESRFLRPPNFTAGAVRRYEMGVSFESTHFAALTSAALGERGAGLMMKQAIREATGKGRLTEHGMVHGRALRQRIADEAGYEQSR